MATKGGVILDIPAFVELALEAKTFLDEVTIEIDGMSAVMDKLRDADIDGLSGGKGEEINESLELVRKMANEIRKLSQQIYIIAHKKASQMDATYADKQAQAEKERLERQALLKK